MRAATLVSGLMFHAGLLSSIHNAGPVASWGVGRLAMFVSLVTLDVVWVDAGILARKDQWSYVIDLVLLVISVVWLLGSFVVIVG